MTSVMATSPLTPSGRSHQPSKGSSPYLSPSRKAAAINFLPPSTEADVNGITKTAPSARKDNPAATKKTSYSTSIAEEKEELLSLLEDIPLPHQSMHASYTILPWTYKLYLALDRSEPSEMAKVYYGSTSSGSDPADEEGREDKEESPQLEDTALPSSLSSEDKRKIYQMVHSALPCKCQVQPTSTHCLHIELKSHLVFALYTHLRCMHTIQPHKIECFLTLYCIAL